MRARPLGVDTWPAYARLVEADHGVWGGGRVEGHPDETDDRTVPGSSLHTGPMGAFDAHGFTRVRAISPHRWSWS